MDLEEFVIGESYFNTKFNVIMKFLGCNPSQRDLNFCYPFYMNITTHSYHYWNAPFKRLPRIMNICLEAGLH